MAKFTAAEIAGIVGSDIRTISDSTAVVLYLSMDSRKIEDPEHTLFFALRGSMHDGHEFLTDALQRGVRHCVVEYIPEGLDVSANWYVVPDSLIALQSLATFHRASFGLEILAITGSNGKTTIKEWLDHLITDRKVVRNPKSYNSQTGVALSLWQICSDDSLGIFEAGISQPGEMSRLENMIRPGMGLFTMLGDAHAEGFQSLEQKLNEKLLLFRHCHTILFEEDQENVSHAIRSKYPNSRLCSWGRSDKATLFRITDSRRKGSSTLVRINIISGENLTLSIPFTDPASIQNCLHCVAVLLVLEVPLAQIADGLSRLHNLPMRLEMKNGIHHSILINDTYNADIQSCRIALDFLSQQAGSRQKILVVSDFIQTGLSALAFCSELSGLIKQHGISEVICVGNQLAELNQFVGEETKVSVFSSTESLLRQLSNFDFHQKVILVKGARFFQLERVTAALSEKAHSAVLETNLQAIEQNLRVFTTFLAPGTKTIAVIKASAYGSGSVELARFLEFRKVSYLAVAFIDEGIQLRKAGISLPVMVLNPDRNGVAEMASWQLEPEVYSLQQLEEIISFLQSHQLNSFNIHIKLDTGMHRLGFLESDIPELAEFLANHPELVVVSIFSHLTSSEDAEDDSFTHTQAARFLAGCQHISQRIGYAPARHLLNSAGIVRFPQYHFDMVRLGLGLYGIDSTGVMSGKLEKVHTLKATVIQVKELEPGARVGYNRKGLLPTGGRIAVVNLGYADGLVRLAGNGNYSLHIRGRNFPIIGNVCMDLTMVDLGDCEEVTVGDEVIVFGQDKPVESLAAICQTIPYEILSRISARVRRIYIQG